MSGGSRSAIRPTETSRKSAAAAGRWTVPPADVAQRRTRPREMLWRGSPASCRLHLIEPLLRFVRPFAFRELGDHALEVEAGLRFSAQSRERGAEVVENGVAFTVVRIGVDQVIETLNRRLIASAFDVEAADDVLVFRQTVERILQTLLRIASQR